MKKIRADLAIVEQGLAETRAKAQAMVLAGIVYAGDTRIEKPGMTLSVDVALQIKGESLRYVSRGGLKLEGALEGFALDVTGKRCLDVGASTGGFTDCLLQRGAASVIALDVGYGQLAHTLRIDPRVHVMERTNARSMTPALLGCEVELTVVDASFIGLEKLMPAIALCTQMGGGLVALIKPQFEVGKEAANKARGVITDAGDRTRAIDAAVASVRASGFRVVGAKDCVLPGPKGNVEAFVYGLRAK
jgi:23S rRNA (cytidine1920-2'-O)/16S rRNA (cytidine1409-2'-O)-methyltransferase